MYDTPAHCQETEQIGRQAGKRKREKQREGERERERECEMVRNKMPKIKQGRGGD